MNPPLSIAVPPSTTFLSPIRALVTSWLGLQHLKADRWCLVITELVTNAMSVTGPDSVVTVDLELDGADVELSVSDNGPGVSLRPITEPDPDATRGRGLLIVDALTTRLSSERRDGRTIVRCRRALADDRQDHPGGDDPSGRSSHRPGGTAPVNNSRSSAAGQHR